MNILAFLLTVAVAATAMYAGLDWLALVFLLIAAIVLLYDPIGEKSKSAWEQVKKADAGHPKEKFDSYARGASKSAADFLFHEKHTDYDYKRAVEKSPNVAKNFFSELKELFK